MRFSASLFNSIGKFLQCCIFLSFLLPFCVRLVPEVLMGRFIVGFDTISYYVPVVSKCVSGGVGFFEVLTTAPLFYGLLTALVSIGVPLTVSLKVLPSLLFGFLGLAIYLYARDGLAWSSKKSLFVSLLACLCFVGLRFSWDMLRSVLGLVFLFVFLALLHSDDLIKSWKGSSSVLAVMVLVVLSHQLVSLIMFVIYFAFIMKRLIRKDSAGVGRLVSCGMPSLALFSLVVYADFVQFTAANAGWLALFGFHSFSDMLAGTVGFLVFCYFLFLPFVYYGVKRLRVSELRVWILWCLIAMWFPVAAPDEFFPMSYRWVLLLVFPLAFFVVEAFDHISRKLVKWVWGGALVSLSLSFVLLPAASALPFFGVFPNYIPSSMLQNSVPSSDCEDVVRVLCWYSQNVEANDVLIVHDAFNGWAVLYLNDSCRVVNYGYENPQRVAWRLTADGFEHVFVIWWVPGIGWHGLSSLPSHFSEVFRSNRIALYKYNSTV
jgi:hypothetical protein